MSKSVLPSPATTALLVIDKQAGYFNPEFVAARQRALPDSASEVLSAIDELIETARKSGVEVVWTQMVENIEESPANIAEKMLLDEEFGHFITHTGQASFDFFGKTAPLANEKVFTKYYYNAFAKTELADYFHRKGIQTLLIVGGYATRCVLSTVVGANSNDFRVVVPEGLTVNQANDSHEVQTLYDVTSAIIGSVMPADEVRRSWGA